MEWLWVFLIGGLICVIGQILLDTTKLTAPRILVIFVLAGIVLTALGWYEPLVKFAKNGATVPLPGFGYTLAKGAIDAAKEGGVMGAIKGGAEQAAAGITAAIAFGYAVALVFSPKSKR